MTDAEEHHEGSLAPLGELPLDGHIEILSLGRDNKLTWERYTPRHHLAAAANDSTALVVVRFV